MQGTPLICRVILAAAPASVGVTGARLHFAEEQAQLTLPLGVAVLIRRRAVGEVVAGHGCIHCLVRAGLAVAVLQERAGGVPLGAAEGVVGAGALAAVADRDVPAQECVML
jgi:hypothetical protein